MSEKEAGGRIDEGTLDALRADLPGYLERKGVALKKKGENDLWCCCPVHDEKTPSFHIFRARGSAWEAKCFGCGFSGDVFQLEAALHGGDCARDFPAIVERVAQGARVKVDTAARDSGAGQARKARQEPEAPRLELPEGASGGTPAEWAQLASIRRVNAAAVETGVRLGTIHFAPVLGFPCWLITDERRRCIEARRMDGKLFPADTVNAERKTHTLRGSRKGWPVGLHIRGRGLVKGREARANDFRALLAVEGQPDYLAALHFAMMPIPGVANSGTGDYLPIAFLGASCNPLLSPEDRALLRGMHVRFYPHCDPNGTGGNAVKKWAQVLKDAGAKVDAFSFEGLRRRDGKPIKDLNDCALVRPEDAEKLSYLLP